MNEINVKDLILKRIDSKSANAFVKRYHLSLTAHGGNRVFHKMTLKIGKNKKNFFNQTKGSASVKAYMDSVGAKQMAGFQFRYIYLIDRTCQINVPIIPYSKIDYMNAGMYLGKKISIKDRQMRVSNNGSSVGDQSTSGGSIPTHTLQ